MTSHDELCRQWDQTQVDLYNIGQRIDPVARKIANHVLVGEQVPADDLMAYRTLIQQEDEVLALRKMLSKVL